MSSKQDVLRQRVYKFYEENFDAKKSYTQKNFEKNLVL